MNRQASCTSSYQLLAHKAHETLNPNPLPYKRHGHNNLAAKSVTLIGGKALALFPPLVLGNLPPLVTMHFRGGGKRAFKATVCRLYTPEEIKGCESDKEATTQTGFRAFAYR